MRKLLLCLTVLLLSAGVVSAQKTINGKVTDEKGTPIANASVLIKGTSSGTTTKADGTYTLSAPASATDLVISSVGFESYTIAIGNNSTLNVSLKAASSELENVVVTGYTTTAAKKFTGSNVTLPIDNVRRQPFASFDQALQGAGSGVSVVSNSGQPGSNAIVLSVVTVLSMVVTFRYIS